jgi:hypothetical protein
VFGLTETIQHTFASAAIELLLAGA